MEITKTVAVNQKWIEKLMELSKNCEKKLGSKPTLEKEVIIASLVGHAQSVEVFTY